MFDQNGVVAAPKGREEQKKWSTCIVQCRSSEVTHDCSTSSLINSALLIFFLGDRRGLGLHQGQRIKNTTNKKELRLTLIKVWQVICRGG
jgi:hypothetical protein